MKSSLHNLIHFLLYLLNNVQLPSPELDPILFFFSQAHIPAGWRLETGLFLSLSLSLSLSYITTHGQSASLSWFQAPIWGL
jgi:hypothetical protein